MNVFHGLGKRDWLEGGICDALPRAQLVDVGLGGTLVRDDGHGCADRLRTTKCDLGCESGAQARVPREGQLGDALKNGRLATV